MTASAFPKPTSSQRAGYFRRGVEVIAVALRGAPWPFAMGIGGAVLYSAMTVAASLVLGWVTDNVIIELVTSGDANRNVLTFAVVAIMGVAVFKATGVVGRRLGAYIAQYTLQAIYRRKITRRYLELPLAWHRRHPTGELLSNANADVESAFFVAAPLPMAIGATVLVGATGGLLLATDVALAVVGFSVVPILALANWHYQRRMRYAVSQAQESRADVAETAHESFDAALVIKTLGREAAETARFATESQRLRDRMITVGRLRAFFDPVIEALPNIGILLVLIVGAYRVRDGVLTPGDLVLFAYLFRLLAIPMRIFGWMLGEMPRAIVGYGRIQRVLGATGAMTYGSNGLDEAAAAQVTVDNVTFQYPTDVRERLSEDEPIATVESDTRGIRNVSFTVDAATTVALVGATGAGKSTIASLLVRLYDPDGGVIRIDGTDIATLERDVLHRTCAIVLQDAFLFDDTVRNNITLGDDVSDADVTWAARIAQADGFIRNLDAGYDTVVGERGATLSGGQRQRIALARALVRRPRLLVLDDATSAIDPAVEADILHALRDQLDTTVVLVAYRTRSILLADEVVFVADGTVAAQGSHSALLASTADYRQLVTAYERAREVE